MAEGYVPRGSMLRYVPAHRAVGQTDGQRGLLIGATHPVPYVGNRERRRFVRRSTTPTTRARATNPSAAATATASPCP